MKGDLVSEVRKMKDVPGEPLVIMGSGSIVSQLTQADLIDDYQLVVLPVVLGKGRTLFEGVEDRKTLLPTETRTFGNGNVLLSYERRKRRNYMFSVYCDFAVFKATVGAKTQRTAKLAKRYRASYKERNEQIRSSSASNSRLNVCSLGRCELL